MAAGGVPDGAGAGTGTVTGTVTGTGLCRANELRHRPPHIPCPVLSLASGRCRVLRRLGATSPLEAQHPPSVLIP